MKVTISLPIKETGEEGEGKGEEAEGTAPLYANSWLRPWLLVVFNTATVSLLYEVILLDGRNAVVPIFYFFK